MFETMRMLLGMSIPIVAIVMGCGIPLLAIYVDYLKRRQIVEVSHRERLAAIEKGVPIPPFPQSLLESGMFEKPHRPPNPRRTLLTGLIWLAVGVGIWATVRAVARPAEDFRGHGPVAGSALIGLIPAGIGLAYLIYYAIEGRKEIAKIEAAPAAKSIDPSGC